MFRYEVTADNIVEIYNGGNKIVEQPTWADGTEWESREQAENWAQVFVESLENLQSEFVPGNSPNNHPISRPVPPAEES